MGAETDTGLSGDDLGTTGGAAIRRQVIGGRDVLACQPVEAAPADRPPILMVHGICHGAWCWESTFLPFFASRGWSGYAVTLRGHHVGATADDLKGHSIADYVEDVKVVGDGLPGRPILIGHSMGGMIVQRYLESHGAAAAVLLASMPPRAPLRSPALRHHPCLLLQGLVKRSALTLFSTPERCRALFFSDHTPDEVVDDCTTRLTDESNRAVLDLLRGKKVRRRTDTPTPMLVVGARNDALFSAGQAEHTAAFYGADSMILADTGHNIMMEPRWREAADHIDAWLRHRLLAEHA